MPADQGAVVLQLLTENQELLSRLQCVAGCHAPCLHSHNRGTVTFGSLKPVKTCCLCCVPHLVRSGGHIASSNKLGHGKPSLMLCWPSRWLVYEITKLQCRGPSAQGVPSARGEKVMHLKLSANSPHLSYLPHLHAGPDHSSGSGCGKSRCGQTCCSTAVSLISPMREPAIHPSSTLAHTAGSYDAEECVRQHQQIEQLHVGGVHGATGCCASLSCSSIGQSDFACFMHRLL